LPKKAVPKTQKIQRKKLCQGEQLPDQTVGANASKPGTPGIVQRIEGVDVQKEPILGPPLPVEPAKRQAPRRTRGRTR